MELLISIAVNGLLGILLLVLFRWKGGTDTVRLSGPAQALELFRTHFPEAVGAVTVTADQRGALIDLGGRGIGLLQRQGRRWNARIIAPEEGLSVRLEPDGAIDLRFADFGWPRARLDIADAEARALWHARFGLPTSQNSPRHHQDPRHA